MSNDNKSNNGVRSKAEKGFDDKNIKKSEDLIDKDGVDIEHEDRLNELDSEYVTKTPEDDNWNTENFDTDHTGDDLDVPGSELDDKEEEIGEEDEENNYYSLGGPRHDK